VNSDYAGVFGRMYGEKIIPNKMTGPTRFALRLFGIKLEKPVGDYVKIKRLPKGWRLTADLNAPGWGHIVDPLGHRRFEFCCLQDQQETIYQTYTNAVPRYRVHNFVLDEDRPGEPFLLAYYIVDMQTRQLVASDGTSATSQPPRYGNATKEDCEGYLDKHYPDWQKPLAYWTKPPRSWWRRLMSWPY